MSLRNAIKDEKELMSLIEKLSDQEFKQLRTVSQDYSRSSQAEDDLKRTESQTKNKASDVNNLAKREEEETRRAQENFKELQKKLQKELEDKRQLEENKLITKKKQVDSEIDRELKEVKERVIKKLEAKKKFFEQESTLKEQLKAKVREEFKNKHFDLERLHRTKSALIDAKIRTEAENREREELALGEIRLLDKLKEHDAKKEWLLEKDLQSQRIELEEKVKVQQMKWQSLTNFFTGSEGRQRMLNIGGFVIGTMGAFFVLKAGYPVLQRALSNYFLKPKLVTKQVKYSKWRAWWDPKFKQMRNTKVVLVPELQQRIDGIQEATKNISKRGGIFGNLLFYGQPGTGKTLFTEKLAFQSEMDFAIMSGPSFDQFQTDEAIVEIKNLFKWANRSKRGLILCVDEADTFLEDRATIKPTKISVLNEWINQTGTESRKFMCVYQTNRPECLDPAVQSRMTQSIEFLQPGQKEILQMLEHYTEKYIKEGAQTDQKTKKVLFHKKIDATELGGKLEEISFKLAEHNFVGRDVMQLVISLVQAAYADRDFKLTANLIDRVVGQQIEKKKMEKSFQVARDQRIADHHIRLSK
eukprot:TRINITY_DN2315_c0_g1_i1.p1 TRINITY_DN2315_c0_g1~~TRINITY_DN2315_c0_g1_i1.p1  ORF type:complete len:585 (+),score=182.32 TRINITY_DN2315_c0_g1_i1:180-1934(+)